MDHEPRRPDSFETCWARDTGSEMQLRDVRTLIDESVDWLYLKDWAAKLGVAAKLDELSK